jgi:hypothetical protein
MAAPDGDDGLFFSSTGKFPVGLYAREKIWGFEVTKAGSVS